MTEQKSNLRIVFAEFPNWSSLTKSDKASLYEQMCQLWKDSERDKATQLFDYLFEHGFDDEKLDSFAESTDVDFQFHYVRKLTDVLENGDFSRARFWLKKVKQNDSANQYTYDDLDAIITSAVSERLAEINQQIYDSFYKKNKNEPGEIFMGEQCAVLNDCDSGHIEFVEKEVCPGDAFNGAQGLILAKDKPVERSKFKMTGFSPELKAIMTKLSQDTDERNCYPNIIDYSIGFKNENGEFETDDFQTECETWKILMQLLAHGYSLVNKWAYISKNSKFLPTAVQEQIKDCGPIATKSLFEDDDFKRFFEDDDDDELNLDDLDLDNLDLDDEDDEKPAKKPKKSKKK